MRSMATIASCSWFLTLGSAAWAACSADLGNLERTMQSGSWQDTEVLVRKIDGSILCEPWEQTKASGLLSTKLIAEARKIDPALRQTSATSLIEKAAKLAVDWRAYEQLGKVQLSAGKFRDATASFQEAINLIADTDNARKIAEADSAKKSSFVGVWKNEATKAERANLAAQADEAKHLAAAGPQGTLVVAASDRSGNPGGVFSAVLDRGAVGVRVPAPVLFEFDSAKLTKVGSEAAQELASFLKSRDPRAITVTGHTDRVGSESYNVDLSKRRAATMAAFLKDAGVNARIVTVGKGFSEPRKLSQGASYTQAQIDELNRRVEFDWN